jgi:tetratricopeptide (TPR) repeat protein
MKRLRMRRVLAGVVAGLAAVGVALPGAADQADMTLGQVYLMQGQFQQAIDSLNEAIDDDPDYAPAYIVRGQAWRFSGEHRKAIDDFSQAIARGLDRSAYVYTIRAEARAAGGELAEAIADYDRALAAKAGFWPAVAGRGAVLAERGDPRALAELDRALTSVPGATITEVLKSEQFRVLSRKGPSGRGTSTLSVTIQTLPVLAATYTARGRLRFAQGAYGPALADLNEALKRVPNLPMARLYRGLTFLALGRCREGDAEFSALRGQDAAWLKATADPHREAATKAGCALRTM